MQLHKTRLGHRIRQVYQHILHTEKSGRFRPRMGKEIHRQMEDTRHGEVYAKNNNKAMHKIHKSQRIQQNYRKYGPRDATFESSDEDEVDCRHRVDCKVAGNAVAIL